MAEWQPIETAPKDGTSIIAAVRGLKSLTIVSWSKDWNNKWCWGTASDIEANEYFDGDFFTDWQPLPEPPTPLTPYGNAR